MQRPQRRDAFRDIIEINSGTFEFTTSENEFPVVIAVSSNTNFLLDVLTELDNERAEETGLRSPKAKNGQPPSVLTFAEHHILS